MNDTLATVHHCAARRAVPVGRALRRRPASLRSMIAAWRERIYFRWELKRISETNPHLIDDIGLTSWQVEEEIAKLPFWQR